MKILVVEDDELNAYALTAVLTDQNYAVEVASDGDAAWDLIETYNYDLILLDVMLPKLDGISLCRKIRSSGRQVPILLLTGCDSSHEKAIGLDAGADDYVVKPFEQEELVARVRALLRRGGVTSQPILEWSSLRLDPSSCEATYADDLLSLTPKEYALLELFLRNSRRVFSCGMILEHLWSYEDTPGEEAVRTHIKGLRQKLKSVGAPGDLIETVYGIGYRLKPQELEGGKSAHSKLPETKQPESDLSKQQKTLAAIAGIWQQFRGRVDEQMRVLEQAAETCNFEYFNPELRSSAAQEAHSLVGSLGTFGLTWASELARKIELLLKSGKTLSPSESSHLQIWVKLMRQEIEGNDEKAVLSPPTADEPPLVLVVEGDGILGRQLPTDQTDFTNPLEVTPKPMFTAEVLEAETQVLQNAPHGEAKILVVDDDPQILALLQTLLSPWGLNAIALNDPRKFWETLEAVTPDMLILDVEMPYVNGIELCQVVRNDPRWSELPILFLTVHNDAEIVNQVFSIGADDFVSKPIIGPELVTRIINRLERVKLLRRMAQTPKTPVAEVENPYHRLHPNRGSSQQAVATLKQTESSYQQLVELCPEAIFIQSEDKFVFLNSAAIKLLGATQAEELLGKSVLDFVHPISQAAVQERITYLREVQQPVSLLEEMWIRLDKTVMELEVVAAPFVYQSKPAVQVVARDISQRKQMEADIHNAKNELELRVAERTCELISVNQKLQSELDERQRVQSALRISRSRFEGILSIADDAIISIDSSQCITLFNKGAEKIFGYSAEEVIGQNLDLLLPGRFSAAHRQHIVDFDKSPNPARRMGERREIFGRRKDGTEFPAEASISKLGLENESVYTVILRDITERRQIERMKDEFVSVVSHELRTPLTSIHGSLGMLASGLLPTDSEQGKRLLQIATDSTERLVRLINDILDIERIESGEVKMERESCNLLDLIGSAVNVLQPLADKAGVTLSISSLSLQLWADPDRIVQTLTNLLSNAIKFSASGSTVWLIAEQQGNEILLSIKDTGRGIPADKLDSIFARFQQVDSSDSRNHEGTGLGLAISKSIVQQHEGRIWVESALGKGSNFYFTIPIIEPPESAELENSDIQDLERITQDSPLVLVCDDDLVIRTDLQTLLQQRGYRVVAVATGEEAIAQAVDQNPDVILLDLLMPGMNGWETMAVLKEREETKDIPIMICSVYKPCQKNQPSADFVDWLSKPVEESCLLQSLRQLIAEPSKRVRILIVEDDDDLADLLVTLFERHEIETFLAKTGREAIRLSQRVNPDVLILDLILPESDGFTVVDWLQQHNQLCSIPVFVYSAKDLDESERQRLKLGHTEFLTKGRVTIQQFEQRVMDLLGRITQNQQGEGES
ncbi:response regulator [Cylindrospermum sp. FACHB-282]|uniref:response regulator n=1 Tax=Cylindrospermum sp. FACHB-282 TaxID=2692794 RepID=UPI0016858BF3|nr:response regulator [Cylindrospermum sp. FACHB-282]MBD2386067.1 response regulator [Cylindrospermum sp. FACHB-282]